MLRDCRRPRSDRRSGGAGARARLSPRSGSARAADGRWTYTNDRNEAEKQKCEAVTRQVNVAPAPKAPRGEARCARPAFPKETPAERVERARAPARDPREGARHRADRARQGAAGPRRAGVRCASGDERNYARVEERLQPFKDSVETHEKNIEALRRELSNLYR